MKYILFTYNTLLFCLLLTANNALFAQKPVTITGDAAFAKNEEIRLLLFDDLLNNTPVVASTGNIDNNGQFSISCTIKQIQLVQLAIRTTKAELFLVPGFSYHFHISTDTVLFKLLDPEQYGGYLQISTDQIDTNDLNYKINRFSNYFDRALNYYAFRLTVDKNPAVYDTLSTLLKSHFDIRYNPLNYYQSYTYYTFGLLDKIFFEKYPDTIYNRYFNNDYILYNNPAYMNLFNSNYENYLYNSRYISKDLLTQTINEKADYLTLFNEAGRDPMLVNERVRELVIIKNLGEMYSNDEFDKGHILQLLQYIKDSSHFPEHLPIIDHLLAHLKDTNSNDNELVMSNEKEKKIRFNQFEGKPIYIQVFQSDCIDCIREMTLIKEFNKMYGDKIQFVSLNLDSDESQYEQFCKRYAKLFDWPILYFNKNYDWLTEHEIETLPDYMIMNDRGKVINRDAPAPEHGLSEYLYEHYSNQVKEEENPMFKNH